MLAAVDGDKVQLAAGVTADSTGRIKAGELVNFVAQQVGGKGGCVAVCRGLGSGKNLSALEGPVRRGSVSHLSVAINDHSTLATPCFD